MDAQDTESLASPPKDAFVLVSESEASLPEKTLKLNVVKSIGGQHGQVTKLLQQLISILDSGNHSRASEVFELQGWIKLAQDKYARSVREFCQTLGSESERCKVYTDQLQARDCEISHANEQVNAFLLEGLAVISNRSSSASSHRSRKRSSCSSTTSRTHTTLSSSSKAHMATQIAEINLEKIKREQALAAKAIALESERAILQAESELAKAKIQSEACQRLLDLKDEV